MSSKKRRWIFRVTFVLLGAAVLLGLYIKYEYTLVPEIKEFFSGADEKQGAELGLLLYQTRGCSGCHTLGNISSSSIGPDLTDLTERASMEQIKHSITNPDDEISPACPNGPCRSGLMPEYASILTDQEIDALVLMLTTQNQF